MTEPEKPLRCERLLHLFQDKPCLMNLQGCTGVAARALLSRDKQHGHSSRAAAHDCYSVWACEHCAAWYETANRPRRLKQAVWERAFQRQQVEWRVLAGSSQTDATDKKALGWAMRCLHREQY